MWIILSLQHAKPEVPGVAPALRPMSADGKLPPVTGARERAASSMTAYFSAKGFQRKVGFADLTPTS